MPMLMILCVVILAWSGWEGVRQGVVRRAIEVVGLLLIFLFASRLAHGVEPRLAEMLSLSGRAAFLGSWIVVLVGGVVAVRLLAAGASRLMQVSLLGWVDRLGGLVLGVAFGSLVASCLLIGVLTAPVDDGLKDEIRDHPFTAPLLHVAPAVYDAARGLWEGDSFFEMLREHVEPAADTAQEGLKALVEEIQRDGDAEN